jgi:hypothetical protein
MEVRTLRGDGNNLYQYALMAAGNRLNDLRLRFTLGRNTRPRATGQAGDAGAISKALPSVAHSAASPASPGTAASPAQGPSGLLRAWLRLLERAQPLTDALARGTRPLTEPFERRGWGDELLVYARRITSSQ